MQRQSVDILMMTWTESVIQTRKKSAAIDGIGPVIAKSLTDYFSDEENNKKLDHLLSYLRLIHKEETAGEQIFAGNEPLLLQAACAAFWQPL